LPPAASSQAAAIPERVSTPDAVCRAFLPRHELLPASANRGYCASPASGKSKLLTPKGLLPRGKSKTTVNPLTGVEPKRISNDPWTLGHLDPRYPWTLGCRHPSAVWLFVSKGAWTVSRALVVDVAPVPYTSLLKAVPY
jgi:hypothetical protein